MIGRRRRKGEGEEVEALVKGVEKARKHRHKRVAGVEANTGIRSVGKGAM